MFTSDIIYFFTFIIKSSTYCISFCFVAWQDIYFIFAHDLARIFISKKKPFQIPLRIKWSPHKRYIGGSRGRQAPFCARLFLTEYFQSLSLFFLPCIVIFALNYVSVKNGFWNKTDPRYRNVWILLWDTCIFVQCGLSSICEDGTTISVVDCVKCSVLVNKCVRPSCSLEDSTYPKKKKHKAGDSPYNVSFLFYETWFFWLTIFIRYYRGLTLFSATNFVLIWTRYISYPLKDTKAL